MRNVLNVLKFEADQNLQKLRQSVDKDKWSTEPAVVNAFYNPNKNDIGEFLCKNWELTINVPTIFLQFSQRESCSHSSTASIFRSHWTTVELGSWSDMRLLMDSTIKVWILLHFHKTYHKQQNFYKCNRQFKLIFPPLSQSAIGSFKAVRSFPTFFVM